MNLEIQDEKISGLTNWNTQENQENQENCDRDSNFSPDSLVSPSTCSGSYSGSYSCVNFVNFSKQNNFGNIPQTRGEFDDEKTSYSEVKFSGSVMKTIKKYLENLTFSELKIFKNNFYHQK